MNRTAIAEVAMRALAWSGLFAISLAAYGFPGMVQAEIDGDPVSVTIDGVRFGYGDRVEIEGPCRPVTHDESFDSLHGPCIDARFLDGRPNLDQLSFHLHSPDRAGKRPEAVEGKWFKIRGTLTDGLPHAVHPVFRVALESIEEVPIREYQFADFADRAVSIEGTALAGGRVRMESASKEGRGSEARLHGTSWPDGTLGKRVEIVGTVRSIPAEAVIENARWKLVELKDQVGGPVDLEGRVWSLNNNWWCEYRGEKLYLTTARGPALKIPGESHGRRVRVQGGLVRQLRPSPDDIGRRSGSELVPCHVVRGAMIEFLEGETVWPEKFGHAYFIPPRIVDSVPELIREFGFTRNRVAGATNAMYFDVRNRRLMQWVLRNPSPSVRDVLSRRMNSGRVDSTFRLLNASMLAAVNDVRGRDYLLATLRARDPATLADTLYCLGIVPKLLPEGSPLTTDMTWADETFIGLLESKETVSISETSGGQTSSMPLPVATATYSSVLERLLEAKTERARHAVLDYNLQADRRFSLDIGFVDPLDPVLRSLSQFTTDELHQLFKTADHDSLRTNFLNELLKRRDPAVVDLFLGKADVYPFSLSLRDHAQRETLEAMRERDGTLTPEAKRWIELLLVLREGDPIPGLLKRLEDPAWPDKDTLTWELARRPDRRAVAPLARLLRSAPGDFFPPGRDSRATWSVGSSLHSIAAVGTREAIGELISLLSTDLSRFPTAYSRSELKRMVAAHLIEQTGESFGTDAAAWQQWFELNKNAFP